MKISVFGLGYVGTVTAAVLASEGHIVVGVDSQPLKASMLASGQSPVIEAGVNDLLLDAVRGGRLSATTEASVAIGATEIAIVCVGTPSHSNGSLDLTYLRRVAKDIGEALSSLAGFFVVVVRSTVLPGTINNEIVPVLEEASGKTVGQDFGVCYNPEFLREGSAIADFRSPPKTVIGGSDPRSLELIVPVLSRDTAPTIQTGIEQAEMVKYADNSWHAIKVAFANEIGSLAKSQGVDGREVMEIFAADEKLNLSAAYLKPGFAFGGSCLPKDVRALVYRGVRLDLTLPLLNAVIPSNREHISRAYELIVRGGAKRVAVLGLAFKAGTDDLRESPMVEIVERLIGKGFDVRIYDPSVNLARLVGANRDFILHQIPHISSLMVEEIDEAVKGADTIVLGTSDASFPSGLADLEAGQRVVDLVRLFDGNERPEEYDGICW